jgi:hypothetical protein
MSQKKKEKKKLTMSLPLEGNKNNFLMKKTPFILIESL